MNYKIYSENKKAQLSLRSSEADGITLLYVELVHDEPCVPEKFTVEWEIPATDTYSFWGPNVSTNRNLAPNWGPRATDARLAAGAPVHAIISSNDKNRLTIALSDPMIPTSISTGVSEETAFMVCKAEFFTNPTSPIKSYSAVVRLDYRDLNYCDTIRDSVSWWETNCGYQSAPVPESARLPMDSLWYSFHQNLDFDEIIRECSLAKPLGLDTVIIDDGWQTVDSGRGYAYCGDWKPLGLPRIAELVQKIHEIGMKVILWYSVPFLGIYAEKYEELRDYTLYSLFDDTTYALDPRYKKVRDYLIDIYENAVRDWKLDGLKLDFIDSFCLGNEEGKPVWERDYTSLEDGVDALMSEVREKLCAIDPEIMIEFRQSYIGPAIRKYGNMLRVGDCPCDALANRRAIIDLRLTSGKTAVHSDMLMWNANDKVENVALQLASTLFSVPQISVHLDKIPESHKKALAFYLDFWRKNRDVLLDGTLYASAPCTVYSRAYSKKGKKAVWAAYENPVVDIDCDDLCAVNCSCHEHLYIDGKKGKHFTTVNCMGETVSEGVIESSTQKLPVPTAGMVFIK